MSLLGISSAGLFFGDESVEGTPNIYPIEVTLDSQDLDVKQINTYNIKLIEK